MPVLRSGSLLQRTYPLSIMPNGNFEKYQQSPMYHGLVEDLQGGEDKAGENRGTKNSPGAVRHKAKTFRLPYIESRGASSFLVEGEVSDFEKQHTGSTDTTPLRQP